MAKNRWTAIAILAVLMFPLMQSRAGSQGREDAAESAVLSAVINRAVLEAKAKSAAIGGTSVFDERYVKIENAKAFLRDLKPVTQDMLEDLIRINKEPQPLSQNLKLGVPHVLLPSPNDAGKASTTISRTSTVFTLSRVAFNDKNDLALVYLTIRCGPRCGIGKLVLLSRGELGWKIVQERPLWIS